MIPEAIILSGLNELSPCNANIILSNIFIEAKEKFILTKTKTRSKTIIKTKINFKKIKNNSRF